MLFVGTRKRVGVVGPRHSTTPASRPTRGPDARVIERGLPGPGTTGCGLPLTSRNGSLTYR